MNHVQHRPCFPGCIRISTFRPPSKQIFQFVAGVFLAASTVDKAALYVAVANSNVRDTHLEINAIALTAADTGILDDHSLDRDIGMLIAD